MNRTAFLLLLLLLVSVVPALAAVELVLKNGDTLKGVNVSQDDKLEGLYVLELEGGESMVIPVELVEEVRLVGDGKPRRRNPRVGVRVDPDAQTIGGQAHPETEPGTPGISVDDDSGTIAGQALPEQKHERPGVRADAPPQTVGGQTLPESGRPSEGNWVGGQRTHQFKGPDGTWTPQNQWNSNNDNWATTEGTGGTDWSRADVETWEPEDSLQEDQSNFNPSKWANAPDNTWTPTDGFRKQNTSLVVAALPLDDAPVPDGEEGIASWYGEPFHGKTTASGATFDMNAYTGAHPDLPFGTLVLVTNLENERNIVVKITDRGPSVEGRSINLSQAAAGVLGMVDEGLARVRTEIVSEAPSLPDA